MDRDMENIVKARIQQPNISPYMFTWVGDDGDYVVAHTSLAYGLDRNGACATHFPLALDEAELVGRLRAMLAAMLAAIVEKQNIRVN